MASNGLLRATPLPFLLLGALLLALTPATAQSPAEEYRVKGAFLLNFTKFVEWPPQAFKGPADTIAICMLGANPFGPELEQAANHVVAGNRAIVVRAIPDIQQARQCQMVFVSVSERRRTRALLDAVKGLSILTVAESEGFIAGGGMIEFHMDESRVRMEIGAEAAKRADLHISAKLLSLAQFR